MISTIIFDFAGVLTKQGFRTGLFGKLAEKFVFDKEILNERFLQNEEQYMSGNMSTQIFWEKLCVGLNISYLDFVEAFKNSYVYNQEILDLIRILKNYKLVLLSDNFEILSGKIKKELSDIFNEMFFSDEMKMTKKSPQTFHIVLSKLNLESTECIFIDDKEKNLVYPKSIGFKTILFKDSTSLRDDLSQARIMYK